MRQPELQTTAPLDPGATWPDGYVVLRQEGAHEKTILYCVSWVRRFFSHYPSRPRRELGRNEIEVPYALARKHPSAPFAWGWQYVFPVDTL